MSIRYSEGMEPGTLEILEREARAAAQAETPIPETPIMEYIVTQDTGTPISGVYRDLAHEAMAVVQDETQRSQYVQASSEYIPTVFREVAGEPGVYRREVTPEEVAQLGPVSIDLIHPNDGDRLARWGFPSPVPSELEREIRRLEQLQMEMIALQPPRPVIVGPEGQLENPTTQASGSYVTSSTLTLESLQQTYRQLQAQIRSAERNASAFLQYQEQARRGHQQSRAYEGPLLDSLAPHGQVDRGNFIVSQPERIPDPPDLSTYWHGREPWVELSLPGITYPKEEPKSEPVILNQRQLREG